MTGKRIVLLIWAAITLLAYGLPAFAQPAGELKIMAPMFGNDVSIPRMETSHAGDYMRLLYDSLVGSTPEGVLSTDYGIANKWEMTPDGLMWTFHLRKGVRFHDGVELTAKDVKFSIEQQMKPDSKSIHSPTLRDTVKNMEVRTPYTIVIQLKKPFIFLASVLSDVPSMEGMIMPKDYFEKVGEEEFIRRPMGSGPYKFHSKMVGSYIKLEAADKHWRGGVPKYKYVSFLIIPEEFTRISMLKSGDGDITRIGRDKVDEVLKAGFKVISKAQGVQVALYCNMQWTNPVFSDIRFRKALNLAVNKDDIIKHIFAGRAKPTSAYPGSNILKCGGDPTQKPYPYSPDEARRLIKEGKWEGYEFTVYSYPRAGCPELHNVVETVCGYWEKIGLKPKIFMTEFASAWENARLRKLPNVVLPTDSSTDPTCPTVLARLGDKYYPTVPRVLAHTPELTKMFDRARASLDLGEVAKILGDIHRYTYDQYFQVPICEINDEIAANKKIPIWNPGIRRDDRNYDAILMER